MNHALVAVTHYCERTDDLFWAEPLNAVTNLIFILTAVLLTRHLRKLGEPFYQVWDIWMLIILVSAIGIGSFLWHTLATPWTEMVDVVPIGLFSTLFIYSFLIRILNFRPSRVLIWIILFHSLNFYVLTNLPVDLLNGSIFYLPIWIGIWMMVSYSKLIRLICANRLIIAATVFTLSLTFRTIDQSICQSWPYGTHFLWHLLNGLTLYLVMNVLATKRGSVQPLHKQTE
jgi:hypothetical protein